MNQNSFPRQRRNSDFFPVSRLVHWAGLSVGRNVLKANLPISKLKSDVVDLASLAYVGLVANDIQIILMIQICRHDDQVSRLTKARMPKCYTILYIVTVNQMSNVEITRIQ